MLKKHVAILFFLFLFMGKRSLSGYHNQGICQYTQNSLLEKNLLDIHQLPANQTDINTTVSSHLSGNPAQSCMKASRGRTKSTAEMLLFRYTVAAGDMAQCQKQRQREIRGNFFLAPQSTTESNGGGKVNSVSKCSSVDSTSSLIVSPLVSLFFSSHYH